MRVLITGGAGFIGSHLGKAHLERGDEVYIIDDLSTGFLENLKPLQNDIKYKNRIFIEIDTILNHEIMLELIGICDVVYHLAAAVGVRYILDNPLKSMITNIQGTDKVLELCSKFKKRVLITSSSEVYGKHPNASFSETDDVVYGPSSKFRWSYAASKLMDEFMAMAYHRTNDLEIVICRLFNTVGPGQTGKYGMVLPRFVTQALNDSPLTVYGDGKQTRTFTYVKDVVNALMKLIKTNKALGEIFNIGGTEEISIKDLATKIIEKTGSNSNIAFIPFDEAFGKDFEDILRRVPNIEKVKKLTGFNPVNDIDKILDQVITHEKNKLS